MGQLGQGFCLAEPGTRWYLGVPEPPRRRASSAVPDLSARPDTAKHMVLETVSPENN